MVFVVAEDVIECGCGNCGKYSWSFEFVVDIRLTVDGGTEELVKA